MGIINEPQPLRPKPLIWMGSTRKDLRTLPADVMYVFGYGLFLAQVGKRHESSKVLRGFGDASVQKKSTSGDETPKRDMDLIVGRLRRAAEIAKEQRLVKSEHKS
jgi:phage-related protein